MVLLLKIANIFTQIISTLFVAQDKIISALINIQVFSKIMKLCSKSILTALFSSLVLSSQAQAASLTPTERVNLVVDWFTGLFNNKQQIVTQPEVPFLRMENCGASPLGNLRNTNAQYVHLEQYINGNRLLRSSGYEFSPTAEAVSLKVYSYLNRDAAIGTCNQVNPTIDLENLAFPSCDLTLIYEPKRFFGTNSPTGCPSSFPSPGSTVVSTVAIMANGVSALDQFFAPKSNAFGSPIDFRRVTTTNEPLTPIALISFGLLGLVASRAKKNCKS